MSTYVTKLFSVAALPLGGMVLLVLAGLLPWAGRHRMAAGLIAVQCWLLWALAAGAKDRGSESAHRLDEAPLSDGDAGGDGLRGRGRGGGSATLA